MQYTEKKRYYKLKLDCCSKAGAFKNIIINTQKYSLHQQG